MALVLETGVPVRAFEGIVERPDGSRTRVFINIDPIFDEAGKIIGAISVFQDITERLETEAALRTTESQLQQFVNSGLFGVTYWTLDANGRNITGANESYAAMVGYTHEEIGSGAIRKDFFMKSSQGETQRKVVEQLLALGVTAPYESQAVSKDGRQIPVLVRSAMLDATVQSGVSLVIDLTELHAVRAKAQLLESQLVHTQKMEAVGQLAGAVAHDFNNLLMVISSQAELLLETADPGKSQRMARQILCATDSAGKLTKKLLALSRKQELASSVFDMDQLLSETTDLIGHVLGKASTLIFGCRQPHVG